MDAREEHLLTVHARECKWRLGSGPLERNACLLYIHYCGYSNNPIHIYYNVISKNLFFHLLESEDEMRARLDEKISCSLFNGNHLSSWRSEPLGG